MIEEDITLVSGDVSLSGTLLVHAASAGIVLFVHGSGPLDRNQDGPTTPLGTFRVLAKAVGEVGFSSLRWDKRGVGRSTGNYTLIGQDDLVADVGAMIDFAHERDLGPVYLCGHSEGTALAPAAAQGRDVAGFILICPYAAKGSDILMQQARRSDAVVDGLPWHKRLLARLFGRPSKWQAKIIHRLGSTRGDYIRVAFKKVPARWLRDFAASNAAVIHAQNKKPTLVVVAQHDAQCAPEDGSKIAAMNLKAELIELPDLSHLLRHTTDPSLSDYARQLNEPQDERVAAVVCEWLCAQQSR